MSNRQFTLTVKATEIIETIPKRSRSKFVSDAIAAFIKKKDILDQYLTKVPQKKNSKLNHEPSDKKDDVDVKVIKKVKIDDDF